MKNKSYSRQTEQRPVLRASAGPKGMAVAPPTNGFYMGDLQVTKPDLDDTPETGTEAKATVVSPVLSGPVQMASVSVAGSYQTIASPPNKTGLPDSLKAGVEKLSGLAMDDVKVHYNSSKPSQMQALAYTRGNDIHMGPGQEPHLPHEAWHVVQQMQGRVKPTQLMKGMAINDDSALESEATVMGARAARGVSDQRGMVHDMSHDDKKKDSGGKKERLTSKGIVQRVTIAEEMTIYLALQDKQIEKIREVMILYDENVTKDTIKSAIIDCLAPLDLSNLSSSLASPLGYSSCFETARRLWPKIAEEGEMETGKYNIKTGSKNTAANFKKNVSLLVSDINKAVKSKEEKVFRIEYGGHGFVLVTRPNESNTIMVEQLQSVAGQFALLTSMEQNNSYTPAVVASALTEMADDTEKVRETGATKLGYKTSDLKLEVKGGPKDRYPKIRMQWWSKGLRKDWAKTWKANVDQRLESVETIVKVLLG